MADPTSRAIFDRLHAAQLLPGARQPHTYDLLLEELAKVVFEHLIENAIKFRKPDLSSHRNRSRAEEW
jgi:hypothetical protein